MRMAPQLTSVERALTLVVIKWQFLLIVHQASIKFARCGRRLSTPLCFLIPAEAILTIRSILPRAKTSHISLTQLISTSAAIDPVRQHS